MSDRVISLGHAIKAKLKNTELHVTKLDPRLFFRSNAKIGLRVFNLAYVGCNTIAQQTTRTRGERRLENLLPIQVFHQI